MSTDKMNLEKFKELEDDMTAIFFELNRIFDGMIKLDKKICALLKDASLSGMLSRHGE